MHRCNRIVLVLSKLDTSSIVVNDMKYLASIDKSYLYPYVYADTVDVIQRLYDIGYRVFISISTSSTLKTFIPWFQEHPDAYIVSGISISSNPVFTGRTTKNIYRIASNSTYYVPVEVNVIKSVLPNVTSSIYLVYENGDDASINEKNLLKVQLAGIGYSPVELGVSTYDDIVSILSLITANDSTFTVLSASTSGVIDAFHQLVGTSTYGYFMEYYATLPSLPAPLVGRYYFVLYQPPYERNIQKMIDTMGIEQSFLPLIDMIHMARDIDTSSRCKSGVQIRSVGSYGYLYFDNVLDRDFPFYTVYILTSSGSDTIWDPLYITVSYGINTDYTLSMYTLPIVDTPSMITPYVYPKTRCSKIAFILSDSTKDMDVRLNIAYLGYDKYSTMFDIAPGGVYRPISYLEHLYSVGYKVFIGLDTTALVQYYKSFFDTHPNAILLSLYSTGASLDTRTNTNIYRMLPPDNYTYEYYVDFTNTKTPTVTQAYFIVQTGDPYAESLYSGISTLLGIPSIRYDVSLTTPGTTYDSIISICSASSTSITFICALSDTIINNIYSRIHSNLGTYIDGGSTTPRAGLPLDAQNCFFLMFNPPYSTDIQNLIDVLGTRTSLPLIDAMSMARSIACVGTYDKVIGSYGYTYFTPNGDRNVQYYSIRQWVSGSWDTIYAIYVVQTGVLFKYTKP